MNILKHRLYVLAFCLIVIAALISFAPAFVNSLGGATFTVDGSQSQQTEGLLHRRFSSFPDEQDVVVFHSDTLTTSDQAYRNLVTKTRQSLAHKPHITGLVSPYDPGSQLQTSANGHTSFMIINLQGTDDQLQKNSATLRDTLPRSTSGIGVYLTGSSPLNADVIQQEDHDIAHADAIGLPVAFIVLLLAFGSIIAASLPLLLGTLGIATTFGILGIFSHAVHFDVFVESAVTMIGLALGIDYSLMIVTRYREELKKSKSSRVAVKRTMNTAGRAVLFSGCTVLVSLSGLLLVRSPLFRGLAVGTMVLVVVMLALCLSLLPAILDLLGCRINALQLFGGREGKDREQAFWARWAKAIMRRPLVAAIGIVTVLLILTWPVHTLRLGLNLGTNTLTDRSSAQGLQLLKQNFTAGVVAPIQVVISRNSGAFTNQDLATMVTIDNKLLQDGRIKTVSSLPKTLDMITGAHTTKSLKYASKDSSLLSGQLNVQQGSNVTALTVIPGVATDSTQATQLLNTIKNQIVPQAIRGSNLQVGYIGTTVQIADLNAEVRRAVPVVLAFVLGISFVLLAFTFRSILLPLKAIIMNLLALGSTFGIVVMIFQKGLGEKMLDFSSPGYIQNYLPLLTFVILFGLSMDYEVFLLSRMREEWLKRGNNTEAVAHGLAHTAKVITHAASIMVVVFLSFLIAHILEIKQLGFALATAVFIDATLIRLILVPATMRLLGKWNWWLPALSNKSKRGRT